MSMNGIDIASYQAGIDLSIVPCDFVIVKATEGTGYINPSCNAQAGQALKLGKKLGLYHFASGGDAVAEANYFVDNIKGYLGKALLVLDWEAEAVGRGPSWAQQWLDRVYQITGVRPLIYMSNSVVNSYDWSAVANSDYGLWNAGYYAGYQAMGYNPDAPLIGGTGAWDGAAIYQYTSSGRLPGWGGNLDLDVFYGDALAWDRYAASGKEEKKMEQVPGNPDNEFGIFYRAFCQSARWLPAVRDGQTAGFTGWKKRMEAFKIDVDSLKKALGDQIIVNAKVHIQGKGWVLYENVSRDTVLGTMDEKRRLEAVEIEILNMPDGYIFEYDVHVQGDGWLGYIQSGFSNGSTGMKVRIEAIRMRIRKIN